METKNINALLLEVGVPTGLLGYKYIVDAIKYTIKSPILPAFGVLYTSVAEQNDTTPPRVERAIRHAIETTFAKNTPDNLFRFFGNTIDSDKGKVTNKNFITTIANLI